MENNIEDWEVWKGDIPFWKHSVAGSIAGVMEHSCFFPLDTIKTCLQSGRIEGLKGGRGMIAFVRSNGIGSLFRGFPAVVFGNVPAHASMFTTYEFSKRLMSRITNRIESWSQDKPAKLHSTNMSILNSVISPAVCGGLSTISHDVIATPLDVVKQRLQVGSYKGMSDCIITMLKKEGICSFYRSLPITLFMNIPQTGLFVLLNENIKSFVGEKKDSLRQNTFNFVIAGISGGIAGFITNPLDVIKTKLQTQACHVSHREAGRVIYPSVKKAFFDTLRKQGIRGMYSGAMARAFLIAPSYALCWGTYETVKNLL
ncbi:putative mitochondrial carrier protein [Cryptosporidium canis]|uniref:Mitochondrial carrier protein n=1 Tax=Cryptosporidium canis TaxID=195482 RepID=A0ABQ8PAP8_9CRYT|nr:putative mitochondrial carrier protein [Cryptosporidium canis]KAJ1614538.1 putative mitochondrial carrier protein [Cryptosporidium canis]